MEHTAPFRFHLSLFPLHNLKTVVLMEAATTTIKAINLLAAPSATKPSQPFRCTKPEKSAMRSILKTRCSTKPGIDNDNVMGKSTSVELDLISQAQTSAAPPLKRVLSAKHSKGLVLDLGPEGSWDCADIGSPVVRRYVGDDDERWYMWYHGRSGGEDGSDSIGLATSSNGVCWARGSGPVRSSRDVGMVMNCSENWWAFDTKNVRPSDMVIMSSPMYSAVYWLYYTGYTEEEVEMPKLASPHSSAHETRSLPGLACSQDGRNWARIEGDYHSGAVLEAGSGKDWDSLLIAAPKVVKHRDDDFRMYYHSYDAEKGHFAIGLARSRDGVRWVKLGKIMGSGEHGSFDELGVAKAHVVKAQKGGKYLMAYEGVSRHGVRSIGLAESEDGLKSWRRLEGGPVLRPSEKEGWDKVGVCSPCLVQMRGCADEWRLYYTGFGDRGRTGIGMAVSNGNDISRFSRWEGFHL